MSKGRRPIGANLKALFRGVDVSPAGSGIVSMHGAKPRRTRGGDAPLTRSRDGRATRLKLAPMPHCPALRYVLSCHPFGFRPTQRVGVASQTKFAKIGQKEYDNAVVHYQSIITIEPGKREGRPCIRRMRIAVADVLGWLADGMSHGEILGDYPELTEDDIRACLAYAADRERRVLTVAHEAVV